MMGAMAFFSLSDATNKWLSADYLVGQIVFFRSLFSFLPVTFLVWRAGGGLQSLRIRSFPNQLLRGLITTASAFMFVLSVSLMPLANVSAFAFTSPLFLTALAIPLLGERVGRQRWGAVVLGFLAVLIMLRPSGEGLRWIALVPIGAALCSAMRDIMTRRMAATESSNATLCSTTVIVTFGALATLPFGWQPIKLWDLPLFALSGLFIGSSYFLMIESFRLAQAPFVAPFEYSGILWSTILGLVIFGDLPDLWIIVGGVLLVACGLYLLRLETRR